jgi:hypothetical protein
MSTNIDTKLAALDSDALDANVGRSLLISKDWELPQLETLVSLAEAFDALDRGGVKLPLLTEELAYALFFDMSTRTKSAWAGAATRLGMQPVIVDGSTTQVQHGETAQETGAMLGMNAHALGVRHDMFGADGELAMRHRSPHPSSRGSAVVARALQGRSARQEGDRQLGLFAELRQAVERTPRFDHAAATFRL